MYLLDTNVISECRKQGGCDDGVQRFVRHTTRHAIPRFLSVITLGELRRGALLLRHRNDPHQATLVDNWVEAVRCDYLERILPVDLSICNVWARMRVPHQQGAIDKLIAATALVHKLIVVTRNVKDFSGTGVEVYNPFAR
ncbi:MULTISPECIES: type II toxin-antitoxin system VapC family toxin [Pandoraea]|uniref:type II toxin-antitoxin system VapC family toxin n=1 Tax=Pandoraea TaxID=93217 RepID=UPI001F5C1987|nr:MULTISPECIES: type II toxin-antitoxin system VapC family toxin [Pandoraea]MCI3207258.1 VapC toxin family PIN domain ribonuclease [Pandoraea sp. LA3]MDN4585287.1 VapC toxin family PIN domain ribonuclease [Pandoraea capi]